MTRARYLADFKQDDGTGYATKYATGFSPQFSGTPTGISATHITTGELPVGVTGGSGLTDPLQKTGGAMTGAITTNSTFDGVDIATRDAVLTSTTATAGAALPKAGGAMTGAITTNSTFDGIDIATRDAILTSTTTTAGDALPKAGGTMTGNLSITSHPSQGTPHCKRARHLTQGNSSQNYNILRYSRFWWGHGCVKITVMETYYGPNTGHGEFIINGHTRSGLPSIHTLHNYNVPTPTAASWNSAEWCYINLNVVNYRRFQVIVESWTNVHVSDANSVAAGNMYHFYSSEEVM